MEIEYKDIPLNEMRYITAGDYYRVALTKWAFRSARLRNETYELLIFFHEFVEWMLTQAHGIAEEDIKKFDEEHIDVDEPGDLPDAPYHNEHVIAEAFERMLAGLLGVDWEDYEKAIDQAFYFLTSKTE